ncbi:MFS transporter [Kineosporia corallincola]|nr:MFS transporter [Kineosporia corallincola]
MLLRRHEPPLTGTPARRLRTELKSGLQFIAGDSVIRGISLHGLLFNAGSYMVMVAFLVKSTSEIDGGAWVYGAALSAAGAGALLGAARSRRVIARVGYGRGLAWSAVIASVPVVPARVHGRREGGHHRRRRPGLGRLLPDHGFR